MTQNHYFVIHYNTIIYYQRHKTLLFLTIYQNIFMISLCKTFYQFQHNKILFKFYKLTFQNISHLIIYFILHIIIILFSYQFFIIIPNHLSLPQSKITAWIQIITKHSYSNCVIVVAHMYFCTMIHRLMWVYFRVDWANFGSYAILQLMKMLLQ